MFEFIRSHQKLMQFVLLLFIAPAFVLLGVSGYSTAPDSEAFAVVGERTITQQEFDNAKRNQIERARRQSDETFDPAVFDTPQANEQLLYALVNDFLIEQSVVSEYLTASDEALQQTILQEPLFQVGGKFDKEAYRSALAARGLTPTQYEANVRYNLARAQVVDPLLQASFNAKPVAELIDDAQLAGKTVRSRTLPLTKHLADVVLSDEEIQNYYEDNQSRFMIPESVKVEYLVLDPALVKSRIDVSDEDIAGYYEQNKDRFTSLEERQARHILFTVEDGDDEAIVKQKAEDVLIQLKDDPSQFAELAKKFSQDPGSAEAGGDLGFFRKGMMVPEFDQAVFSLPVNQISEVIKTDFGFHIIEVTDIQGGDIQPLDEVREQIVDEIRAQKLTLQMAEAQDTFSEKVFEGGQSFEGVEEALNLEAQTAEGIERLPANNSGVFTNRDLLTELFSEDSLTNRNNTKAVTVNESLVSARVVGYSEAKPKSLSTVRGEIEQALKVQKASEAAMKEAEALADRLKDEATREAALEGFNEEKTVSALTTGGLPTLASRAILDVEASELPVSRVVGLGDQGYLVAWVTEQVPASEIKKKAEPQIVNAYESLASRAYGEAISVAAREALANRVGLEVLKQFTSPE